MATETAAAPVPEEAPVTTSAEEQAPAVAEAAAPAEETAPAAEEAAAPAEETAPAAEETAPAAEESTPAAEEAAPAPAPTAAEDALAQAKARAMAVAAKLSEPSRKREREEGGSESSDTILIPEGAGGGMVDVKGVIEAAANQWENETGCRVQLRGPAEGAGGQSAVITGPSDEAVADCAMRVRHIVDNPQAAMELRKQQLIGGDATSAPEAVPGLAPAPAMGMAGHYGGMPMGGGMHMGGGMGDAGAGGETMTVPNNLVGGIIGRGGETIRRLQAETGATVKVDSDAGGSDPDRPRNISIFGPPEVIANARAQIQALVDEKRASLSAGMPAGMPAGLSAMGGGMGGMGGTSIVVPVPNESVGSVIGRGGANIRMLESQTGCRIQVPKAPPAEDPANRHVQVTGSSAEAVENARQMIFSTIQNERAMGMGGGGMGGGGMGGGGMGGGMGGPRRGMPGGGVDYVDIPNDRVGSIIGKRGAVINEIQQMTGTHIDIPSEGAGGMGAMRRATITGPPEAVAMCKQEIARRLASFDDGYGGGGGGGGGGYGAPAAGGYGGYGAPAAGGYGAPAAGGYGADYGAYGAQAAGGYGAYGAQAGGYGAPAAAAYGAQTGGYGAQAGGYGAQAGGYGAPPQAGAAPTATSGYDASAYAGYGAQPQAGWGAGGQQQ